MKGYRIAMKLINQTKIFKFIVPIIVFCHCMLSQQLETTM